jgi:hypothetical protein
MRRFKGFPPRGLRFRLLLILAGAVLLLAALAPTAKADLIVYFNFEDSFNRGPPDFTSDVVGAPDFNPGGGVVLTTMTTDYNSGEARADHPGIGLNRSAGDIDLPRNGSPDLDVSLTDAGNNNNRHFDFNVLSSGGFYQDMTLSFAVRTRTGGFTDVTVQYSINGGGTWTTFGTAALVTNVQTLVSFGVPIAANNAPNLAFRFFFTGGTGTSTHTQYTEFDNLQLTGTIVPEPATVAAGLLSVLGLCWHQRRRLIRSVRFRRA